MCIVEPENNIGRQVIEIQGTTFLQLTKSSSFASLPHSAALTNSSVTQPNPYPKNVKSQGQRNMQY